MYLSKSNIFSGWWKLTQFYAIKCRKNLTKLLLTLNAVIGVPFLQHSLVAQALFGAYLWISAKCPLSSTNMILMFRISIESSGSDNSGRLLFDYIISDEIEVTNDQSKIRPWRCKNTRCFGCNNILDVFSQPKVILLSRKCSSTMNFTILLCP